MSFFRRSFSLSATLFVLLIVLSGLAMILFRPAWILEGGTPVNIKIEHSCQAEKFSLLDHPDLNLVTVRNKAENVTVRYSNNSTGRFVEQELSNRQVVDKYIHRSADNVYFCISDLQRNCYLVKVFDENGLPNCQETLIFKNKWTLDIEEEGSLFGDIRVFFHIDPAMENEFELLVENQNSITLRLNKAILGRLLGTKMAQVSGSIHFREIAAALSEKTGQQFTSIDVYKIITDKLRRYWLKENLTQRRGQSFFLGKILLESDLDGDGKEELLVSISGDRFISSELICLGRESREIQWRLPLYATIEQIGAFDLDADGKKEVVISTYASASGCSSDWFSLPVKLDPAQSSIIVLNHKGRQETYNGRKASLGTGGFTTKSIFFLLPSGLILAAPTSVHDSTPKNLLAVDFAANQIDTLDISYTGAVGFCPNEQDNIHFICIDQDRCVLKCINSELEQDGEIEIEAQEFSSLAYRGKISWKNKAYHVMHPLMILDENYRRIFQEINYDIRKIDQRGEDIILQGYAYDSPFPKLYELKLLENKILSPYFWITWCFALIIAAGILVFASIFDFPLESTREHYAILINFLGVFYNWRLYGEKSIYKQPLFVTLKVDKFYDMLKDISENYQRVSQKNLGIFKINVYQLTIGNDMYIIQRIAHEIKNQVHLLNMQVEEEYFMDSSSSEREISRWQMKGALKEIYNKSSTLSNFSRINLMHKDECDLVTILDDLIIRYNSHPRFKDICWDPRYKTVTVLGDESLLLTAFINLLDNALKYSQEDTIVSISLEKDEDEAVIVFSNSKKETSSKPDLALKAADSIKPIGSGIGLMISEKVILSHKGRFRADLTENVRVEIRLKMVDS